MSSFSQTSNQAPASPQQLQHTVVSMRQMQENLNQMFHNQSSQLQTQIRQASEPHRSQLIRQLQSMQASYQQQITYYRNTEQQALHMLQAYSQQRSPPASQVTQPNIPILAPPTASARAHPRSQRQANPASTHAYAPTHAHTQAVRSPQPPVSHAHQPQPPVQAVSSVASADTFDPFASLLGSQVPTPTLTVHTTASAPARSAASTPVLAPARTPVPMDAPAAAPTAMSAQTAQTAMTQPFATATSQAFPARQSRLVSQPVIAPQPLREAPSHSVVPPQTASSSSQHPATHFDDHFEADFASADDFASANDFASADTLAHQRGSMSTNDGAVGSNEAASTDGFTSADGFTADFTAADAFVPAGSDAPAGVIAPVDGFTDDFAEVDDFASAATAPNDTASAADPFAHLVDEGYEPEREAHEQPADEGMWGPIAGADASMPQLLGQGKDPAAATAPVEAEEEEFGAFASTQWPEDPVAHMHAPVQPLHAPTAAAAAEALVSPQAPPSMKSNIGFNTEEDAFDADFDEDFGADFASADAPTEMPLHAGGDAAVASVFAADAAEAAASVAAVRDHALLAPVPTDAVNQGWDAKDQEWDAMNQGWNAKPMSMKTPTDATSGRSGGGAAEGTGAVAVESGAAVEGAVAVEDADSADEAWSSVGMAHAAGPTGARDIQGYGLEEVPSPAEEVVSAGEDASEDAYKTASGDMFASAAAEDAFESVAVEVAVERVPEAGPALYSAAQMMDQAEVVLDKAHHHQQQVPEPEDAVASTSGATGTGMGVGMGMGTDLDAGMGMGTAAPEPEEHWGDFSTEDAFATVAEPLASGHALPDDATTLNTPTGASPLTSAPPSAPAPASASMSTAASTAASTSTLASMSEDPFADPFADLLPAHAEPDMADDAFFGDLHVSPAAHAAPPSAADMAGMAGMAGMVPVPIVALPVAAMAASTTMPLPAMGALGEMAAAGPVGETMAASPAAAGAVELPVEVTTDVSTDVAAEGTVISPAAHDIGAMPAPGQSAAADVLAAPEHPNTLITHTAPLGHVAAPAPHSPHAEGAFVPSFAPDPVAVAAGAFGPFDDPFDDPFAAVATSGLASGGVDAPLPYAPAPASTSASTSTPTSASTSALTAPPAETTSASVPSADSFEADFDDDAAFASADAFTSADAFADGFSAPVAEDVGVDAIESFPSTPLTPATDSFTDSFADPFADMYAMPSTSGAIAAPVAPVAPVAVVAIPAAAVESAEALARVVIDDLPPAQAQAQAKARAVAEAERAAQVSSQVPLSALSPSLPSLDDPFPDMPDVDEGAVDTPVENTDPASMLGTFPPMSQPQATPMDAGDAGPMTASAATSAQDSAEVEETAADDFAADFDDFGDFEGANEVPDLPAFPSIPTTAEPAAVSLSLALPLARTPSTSAPAPASFAVPLLAAEEAALRPGLVPRVHEYLSAALTGIAALTITPPTEAQLSTPPYAGLLSLTAPPARAWECEMTTYKGDTFPALIDALCAMNKDAGKAKGGEAEDVMSPVSPLAPRVAGVPSSAQLVDALFDLSAFAESLVRRLGKALGSLTDAVLTEEGMGRVSHAAAIDAEGGASALPHLLVKTRDVVLCVVLLLGSVFLHRAHKRKATEHITVVWAVLSRWASVEAMLAGGCGNAHCTCDLCAQALALKSVAAAGHAPSSVAPGPVRWMADVGVVAAWLRQCYITTPQTSPAATLPGAETVCDVFGIPTHPQGVDASFVAARTRLIETVLNRVRSDA